MDASMTFDEVIEKAIASGHLSAAESTEMKQTLIRMRELANKESMSLKEKTELDRLTDVFNGFAAKGMPELAKEYGVSADYYRNYKKSAPSYKLVAFLLLIFAVVCIVIRIKNI